MLIFFKPRVSMCLCMCVCVCVFIDVYVRVACINGGQRSTLDIILYHFQDPLFLRQSLIQPRAHQSASLTYQEAPKVALFI